MAKTIGVVLSERIISGLVVDHKIDGHVFSFPANEENESALVELHTDAVVETICEQVKLVQAGQNDISAVGVAMPGLIRDGVVEDSPNLPQLKGARIKELLTRQLKEHGLEVPVCILNDADGVAAGLAASQGKLDQFIRVWTLGIGIGYGRYPWAQGVWEGGHTVITLDDKENYCGCGGRGHMEGIMGHRAMRLRFLDMEPEEVFAEAAAGDKRCIDFKKLWHRALAAGIANRIHMEGAGKFFMTGFNSRFVDMPILKDYLQQMVKMSPLQSYQLEIVADDPVTRVIGAAVSAEQAAFGPHARGL
jgi:glucokinase